MNQFWTESTTELRVSFPEVFRKHEKPVYTNCCGEKIESHLHYKRTYSVLEGMKAAGKSDQIERFINLQCNLYHAK